MSNQYDREELFALLDAYCRAASSRAALSRAALSDAQSQRLASILRGSSQSRRDYLEYMDLHAALQWEVGSRAEIAGFVRHCRQELQAESPPSPKSAVLGFLGSVKHRILSVRRGSPALVSGLAAMLCAAAVVAFLFFGRGADVPPQQVAPLPAVANENGKHRSPEAIAAPRIAAAPQIAAASAEAVAHVTQLTDCRWADDAKSPKTGEPLAAHRLLELRSGVAEILFNGGARGVLRGPAAMEIASADSAILKQGEFTVDNPVAKNFNLLTPSRKYMLSSAEFGVCVASADVQEFHVYRGRVTTVDIADERSRQQAVAQDRPSRGESDGRHEKDAAQLVLTANEACRIGAGDKPVERFAADRNRFVHASQAPVAQPLLSPDYLHWKEASEKLRKDPTLIAYYDFQTDIHSLTTLPNRSAAGAKLDGRIDGADWIQGRWPTKGALQCHGPSHCVHLNIPGRYEVVTAAAWVNVLALKQPVSSLLDADVRHATAGQCYWRILGDGRVVMGPRAGTVYPGAAGRGAAALADRLASVKPLIEKSDRGAWCFLVAIYDSRANTVTYYKNGLAFGSVQPSKPLVPLVFGPCELGNGGDMKPKRREDMQVFFGFIDEFMLFSRALSLEEIQEMLTIGKCDEIRS